MTSQVLLVEDDPASCDILTQLLEFNQISVEVAATAEAALDLLRHNQYTLAMIDLALPEMDGWQLLEAIQSNPATRTLRSVAVTAFYNPELAFKARQAGFLECFPKPVTLDLVNEIREFLN